MSGGWFYIIPFHQCVLFYFNFRSECVHGKAKEDGSKLLARSKKLPVFISLSKKKTHDTITRSLFVLRGSRPIRWDGERKVPACCGSNHSTHTKK
jgi:hypothetical protein